MHSNACQTSQEVVFLTTSKNLLRQRRDNCTKNHLIMHMPVLKFRNWRHKGAGLSNKEQSMPFITNNYHKSI